VSKISIGGFAEFTGMWEDDPTTVLAWLDFIDDEDYPSLSEWWAEFQGDYI